MSNHEGRLDRYIDSMNAGRPDSARTDDAELAGLFDTVRDLHALRESDVPIALAAGLARQLRSEGTLTVSNSHPERSRVRTQRVPGA